MFRGVDKSCRTIETSAYRPFGYLSIEVRHPNVLPGCIGAAATCLAGSHMNPEHPASHPPGLSPGSNLAGIIEVLDYVVAAQLIEKLRDDARSLAPSAVRVEILDRVRCDRNVIRGRFRHPLSPQRRRQKPFLSKGSASWS